MIDLKFFWGMLSRLISLSMRALCLRVKGGEFIEELELDVCSPIQLMFGVEIDGLGCDIPPTSSK